MISDGKKVFMMRVNKETRIINAKSSKTFPRKKRTQIERKSVAVILGYYNGEAYIEEQLFSIFNQSHKSLHVFLYDDYSAPQFILQNINSEGVQRSKISATVRPKNIGFANNFMKALADIKKPFEFYSFSDQDDIWNKNKLEIAISALSDISSEIPALYCARTEIVDEQCVESLGYSPLFTKDPTFSNALVQNIGGGNTMVFNKAARDLIISSVSNCTIVSHDWWCYLIVTGAGGHVIYDAKPCLKYRQHKTNVIGSNTSWRGRFSRFCSLLQGHFLELNDINTKALEINKHLLTKDNLYILDNFMNGRRTNLIKRLILLKRSKIYRQTLLGNIGLLVGIFFKRI